MARDNARLVQQHLTSGHTDNADFDRGVGFARALYGRGLSWVESQLQ